MQPPPQLVTTLYREFLRSCRRTRAVMRPGHVSLVGQCVQRFADSSSPSLIAAVKEHGPLPLPGLVRHAFRSTEPSAAGDMCDDAFRALRMLHHVEEWVNTSARYTSFKILSTNRRRSAFRSQTMSSTTASRASAIARRPRRRAPISSPRSCSRRPSRSRLVFSYSRTS